MGLNRCIVCLTICIGLTDEPPCAGSMHLLMAFILQVLWTYSLVLLQVKSGRGASTTWLLCGFVRSSHDCHLSAPDAWTAANDRSTGSYKNSPWNFAGFSPPHGWLYPSVSHRNHMLSCGHTTKSHWIPMGVGEYYFIRHSGSLPERDNTINAGDETKQQIVQKYKCDKSLPNLDNTLV